MAETTQIACSTQMPLYQSHKKVWALKIKAIHFELLCASAEAGIVCGQPQNLHTTEAAKSDVGLDHDFVASASSSSRPIITPEDEGFAPFPVDWEYMVKHRPKVGGYYVVYNDGYKSWSPAEAFEEGYTRI